MTLRPLVTALVLALGVLTPQLTLACWDGIAVSSETVHISISDEDTSWALEDAEHYADLVAALDALTPVGAIVDYQFGMLSISDADDNEVCELGDDWDGVAEADLLEVVARACGRSEAELEAAERLSAPLFTVQVASTASAEAASRVVSMLEQTDACYDSYGFYEAGGFPSFNPCAHVLETTLDDGRVVHRVIVGAFLSRKAAEAASTELETEIGHMMMVRSL